MLRKGVKHVADIQHNVPVHPYFTLMCLTRQPNRESKVVCGCVVLRQTVVQIWLRVPKLNPTSMLMGSTCRKTSARCE